jgi:hypothetical protein
LLVVLTALFSPSLVWPCFILALLVPPRNLHDQHRSVVKFDGAADHLRAEFGNQQIAEDVGDRCPQRHRD